MDEDNIQTVEQDDSDGFLEGWDDDSAADNADAPVETDAPAEVVQCYGSPYKS